MGNNPAVPLFLVVLFLVLCFQAKAQQQKVYRAGVLMLGSSDIPSMKGLSDGLKELGYVEGKNLLLDIPVKETPDELRPIAKAYIEKQFDVIVGDGCHGTPHRQGIDTRNSNCICRRYRPYRIRTCKIGGTSGGQCYWRCRGTGC